MDLNERTLKSVGPHW